MHNLDAADRLDHVSRHGRHKPNALRATPHCPPMATRLDLLELSARMSITTGLTSEQYYAATRCIRRILEGRDTDYRAG